MNVFELLIFVVQDALLAAVAATGFAMVFNVPRRTLFGCAAAGAVGHASRALLIESIGLPIEAATLAGAALVGFASLYLARRLRAPAAIFNVCGAIPLVPGMFAYSAMIGLIRLADPNASSDVLIAAAVNMVKTGLILGAIAAGIALPNLLFRRERPIV